MKKLIFVLALFFTFGVFAEIVLLEPEDGAVMPTLTDPQKAYLKMRREERREKFADKEFRNKEMGMPAERIPGEKEARKAYWPKTTHLRWEAKDGTEYTVKVVDKKKGDVVFEGKIAKGDAYVDNLEIAAEYEWSVSAGDDTAKRSFKTEDMPPRLIRYPGVPNVRDLGGRVGLDGHRVKQGMIIRSAGLNENAGDAYYTLEELKELGKDDEIKKSAEKVEARLNQLKAWQADPASFDGSDPEYKDWTTRHKDEPAEKFFKSRISRAEHEVKKSCPRIKKGKVAGKSRVEGANGEYILKRFGIKSDIDLRRDDETFGMTGSPLGDSVTWFHYSSAQYGGILGYGKEAFANEFKVFLDEKNYPIDFHCIAGQDRTGALAFVLNALLGVEEEELYKDWETTGFWNRGHGFNHEKMFDSLIKAFAKKYPGKSYREASEEFVLSLGFTTDDIAKFRKIMLED